MKIGILTLAYNEERFAKDCIRQFKGFLIDKHLFLISDTPWHGEKLQADKTADIAEKFGAEVIVGDWQSETEQRNFGLDQLKDCDWVLIVDADEHYEPKAVARLISFLEKAALPAYGIGRLLTYWKDKKHIVDPEETGGLIVAVRPSVRFIDKRCIDSEWDFLPEDIVMHHYSYVRTDEEMKKKISSFEHAEEIVPNWYEDVWLKWTPEMKNVHPVNPGSFKKIIKI